MSDDNLTHAQQWNKIEEKHFGRCYWQMLAPNRMVMVELLDFPEAKTTAVVVKHFDKAIPRSGSHKPWPEHIASYVYLPVDDSNTWDGLEKHLMAKWLHQPQQ